MSENSRPTILNVDDDRSGRYATTRLLRKEGYHVLEAETGAEALQLLGRKPDLVLLDVNLPDMSGFEVCRRIKTGAASQFIPVLHLSATAVRPEQRAQGLETGADAYLVQPVEPEVLVATIRALLRVRRAEADARESARNWQATFNAISDAVCLIDREGRVRQVNPALVALLGKPEAEIVGSRFDEVLPPGIEPDHPLPFERARASLHREVSELRAENRYFQVTVDPVTNESGQFEGAVRTIVDITESKRAQNERDRLLQQIEQQRARLEGVVRSMPVGIMIAEAPSGRLLMCNDAAVAIWRQPSLAVEDFEGYIRFKAFHPSGRPYEPRELPLARSITAGEVVVNEQIDFARGDSTRGTMLVSSTPIRDRHGFVIAGVQVCQDVTERRHLEDQLRQSQKMEAVGRLAGGVAHDFNNLLTIIGGYGQMLMDSLDPSSPMRNDLEAIVEAATRATALTRQLLTFSRRQIVQPKVLDLNRHVSRMNRMLRRVIGEDVQLVTHLKSGLPRINADPGQIEQVLLNLTVNARDAMPSGGALTIETADLDIRPGKAAPSPALKPGRYVVLSIADTGTGMDPEVMSHLFEPFFTTKAKGKGTGLGLSTVYGIVKQSGGDITAESELGHGAVFKLYFPAVVDAGVRQPAERREPAPPADIRGHETVLLVEDEADVRRLACDMLARLGYSVLEAASGADALRIWRERGPSIDLLLTDVIMPQMSGRELADNLKADRPDVKIMFMSGYADDVLARHGIHQTGAAFLHKPFTVDVLGRKLRSILDAKPRKH